MYEGVINLEKEEQKQKDLLLNIISFANNCAKKYTEETRLNFVIGETSKHRPLNKLMALDKAIYGIKKNITDKNSYSRIDSLFKFKETIKEDFKYIGRYQKLLSGGNLFVVELPKTINIKKMRELIDLIEESDIGFVKFSFRK